MIAAELQQRDEALTAAGHDPECAAFDDRDCSCGVVEGGATSYRKASRSQPAAIEGLHPVGPVVTLAGFAATAYERYRAAAKALKQADLAHKAAQREYQEAHQAFADATADG